MHCTWYLYQMLNVSICVFQREEEIARRRALREKKRKEREEQLKNPRYPDLEQQEEGEEQEGELPPPYVPDPPSPINCVFYSQPGQFWLSMVHTATQHFKILFLRAN